MKPLLLLALTTTLAFSQGPLLPLSAPAPSMKTLDQIEPRTAISASSTITQPGSYYFTKSFTGTITIAASDVTLDLHGFTLTSTSNGITISGSADYRNITLRNGTLVGPGTMTFTGPVAGTYNGGNSYGVITYGGSEGSATAQNCYIDGVTVRGFYYGIHLQSPSESDGGRNTISNCTVRDFGGAGITAPQCAVRDTLVHSGIGIGVSANVLSAQNLMVDRIVGVGISGNNLNLEHISLRSCSGNGIQATSSQISGGKISGCLNGIGGGDNQIDKVSIIGCTSHGILSPNSSISHVTSANNTGAGIWADSSTISYCTVRANGGDGIRGIFSIISNCKSSANDTNPDSYGAAGIYWVNGRQIDNVSDLYVPAAPAP